MGAYEALWEHKDASFKTLAKRFATMPGAIPSYFVEEDKAREFAGFVLRRFEEANIGRFGVLVHGAGEYPERLQDATYPVELLYFQGWLDLVSSRSVAVVGTRTPSPDGIVRTRQLVRELVKDDITIVSGLAAGIDRAAHEAAIDQGGRTIAVLGTPLSHNYPKDNASLQRRIAEDFLVISQIPVVRYESQDYRLNRFFFPERNATMSALTEATVIVEAGETSGALVQARAAIAQGRKLFILDSCFRDLRLKWPARFADQGAIRVTDYDDIRRYISSETD
jgi:DNA processing protein